MMLFGLIGSSLQHSFSKEWFNRNFAELNIDARYENFELSGIDEVRHLIANYQALHGLNVTIPYKQSVMPLLDYIAPEATEVGAVNTVKIIRKAGTTELHGYNTDVYGFAQMLDQYNISGSRALIFGNGGAAQAVRYVLRLRQIEINTISRQHATDNYSNLTPSLVKDHPLLINATPVGMYPTVNERLPIPQEGVTSKHTLIDLIYNPAFTSFMQIGQERGAAVYNGKLMLQKQAEKAWEIWLGTSNSY